MRACYIVTRYKHFPARPPDLSLAPTQIYDSCNGRPRKYSLSKQKLINSLNSLRVANSGASRRARGGTIGRLPHASY